MSYFTAIFPYIILTALIMRGLQLDGADKGIEFYIGKFDMSRFYDAKLWMDAVNIKSLQLFVIVNLMLFFFKVCSNYFCYFCMQWWLGFNVKL